MESFLRFFEQMTTGQKLLWVLICLSAGWLLELLYPLVRLRYRKWRHAGVNAAFLLTRLVINLAFGVATVAVLAWLTPRQVGLLHLCDLPVWAELLLTLLLLDFVAQYVAHYLLHHVGWLWRFHIIHHSDTKVDATTGVRLHPGDYTVRETFALAGLILAGAPIAFYLVYRVVTIFFTFFSHANVAVPRWLDAPLSWVFVTPNLHKFHHHHERPWTDTNFGGIFSIWDRLFGTLVYDDPLKVHYGIDTLDGARDEDVLYQFRLPFERHDRQPNTQSQRAR
jgi:sterol desaturase/sphingolipid hydroxylase (fatty acid hydroxylase superfamily)